MEFSNLLLEKTGIIVTPGIGYGDYGEGYVRIALTVEEKRLEEAIGRMEKGGLSRNRIEPGKAEIAMSISTGLLIDPP